LATITVGTSLERGGPTTRRGYVDVMDCLRGVRGWAIDLAKPGKRLRVELFAGETAVAEIMTNQPREDISRAVGQDVAPGFIFQPDAIALLADHADSPDDPVTVRIAGTNCILSQEGPAPTVGALIAALATIQEPTPPIAHIADFDLMLQELRAAAAGLVTEGLSPIPENHQGFIETVAVDSAGQVWIVGWMHRGHLLEFSAVISDRKKTPAAVVLMTYARDDLPPHACGVIGLVASTWRPTSATNAFYLFFGGGGRFHLESNAPLRVLSTAELAAEFGGIRDKLLGDGRTGALQRRLTTLETWAPTREGGQTYATVTSIDRVLVVPGLGCLVEGWVISPMKRIVGLRLRLAGVVMAARTEALYWKPRPDLLDGYPGTESLVARAGFVGLFAGDAEPDEVGDPIFKVMFEGGASANWQMPPNVFRRLGHSADIEDALRFFPALLEESFFPGFAAAAITAQHGEMSPPVKLTMAPAKRVLVLVLPEERCDLFMVFEDVADQCRAGAAPEGVVFVASAKGNRSDALWLFREFQAQHSLKSSLLVIDEASQAFAQLGAILRDVGATRFVFVGAGVFLTEAGWRHAGAYLRASTGALMLLGLTQDAFEHRDPDAAVSARCFGWTTTHFATWATTASPFLGGYHRDNGLFRADMAHELHHNAARTTRTMMPTRIQHAVNATVYRMSAQHAAGP
jgi:hypothetical protein